MLCWKILYSKCYAGAVHAVLEEICSCCIGGYCTVGDMMELFMLCWRSAVHAVLVDTIL